MIQNDFIDNGNTLIQVKVPDMPPSKIKNEMCPNGILRECINKLESKSGKYIIISSKADTSYSTYNERIKAMNECKKYVKNVEIDFYDCSRITNWVNEYPGICIWVQEKNGHKIFGWQSYNNWAILYEKFGEKYIFDETSFLFKENYDDNNKITVTDGINEIRNLLDMPQRIVRIAGLSGVGKTRLAFALFDEKIGINALNSDLVLYCDIGDSPLPDPTVMLEYLIKNNIRAIVIVDNCEKNYHIKLAQQCQKKDSLISLLTIEYDAKKDDIIESNNYYLANSSDNIITQFLRINFPLINHANISTITNCSGGNFRLAKYLATSIDKNNTIGILNNNQIFDRLFMNENKTNQNLLTTAEICSLLFSFNINTEIELLTSLCNITETEFFRNISLLKEMQIIQSRGDMRAILPHALANKLASDCLKRTSLNNILDLFQKNKRMFLSFSRRLKFLHTSTEAINISLKIIETGKFNKLEEVSEEEIEILRNLSFIIPKKILELILNSNDDDFYSRKNKNFNRIVDILIYLAYDKEQFDIVVPILIRFMCSENENETNNSIRKRVYILFHIYLSGTYADITQRINIVKSLLLCNNKVKNEIGLKLLDELLKTGNFIGNYIDFGSQKRDYGYYPKNNTELTEWYDTILTCAREFIETNNFKNDIKDILANNFVDLVKAGNIDKMEEIVKSTLKQESWPEIWIGIKYLKHFNIKEIPPKILKQLNDLESEVFPKTIEDEFKVYVRSTRKLFISADDFTDDFDSLDSIVFSIGKKFGEDIDNIKNNIELIKGEKNFRAISFGQGLAENEKNINDILMYIIDSLSVEEINNNSQVLSGIIYGMSTNIKIVSKILDKLLINKKTKHIFPILQGSYDITELDMSRIIKALHDSEIPIFQYRSITYHLSNISDDKIIDYLNAIPSSIEGMELKIDILFHLLHRNNNNSEKISNIAAITISNYPFNKDFSKRNTINYEITQLISIIFSEGRYSKLVENIFSNFLKEISKDYISFSDVEDIFEILITNYQEIFLNIILKNYNGESNLRWFLTSHFHKKPLSFIEDDIMIKWLKSNKMDNEVLPLLEPYVFCQSTNNYKWTKLGEFYIHCLEENYNKEVLNNLIKTIYPNSWDETLPDILLSRISLIEYLINNQNYEISEMANREKIKLLQRIDAEKEMFLNHRKEMFNSFE